MPLKGFFFYPNTFIWVELMLNPDLQKYREKKRGRERERKKKLSWYLSSKTHISNSCFKINLTVTFICTDGIILILLKHKQYQCSYLLDWIVKSVFSPFLPLFTFCSRAFNASSHFIVFILFLLFFFSKFFFFF